MGNMIFRGALLRYVSKSR